MLQFYNKLIPVYRYDRTFRSLLCTVSLCCRVHQQELGILVFAVQCHGEGITLADSLDGQDRFALCVADAALGVGHVVYRTRMTGSVILQSYNPIAF